VTNGVITVHRPRGGWRDFARSYRIEIDGELRGRLWRGQSMDVPVPAGRHVVRAAIDWTGSEDLDVDVGVGSCTRVRVEPSGRAWEALWHGPVTTNPKPALPKVS
jgi:hypothetical protein